MSQIEFHDPVRTMRGKFEKQSKIIMRKKAFRAPSGVILKEGVQESYVIVNPRNYKTNPPKGTELANIKSFGEAKRIASDIINSAKISDDELAAMTPDERARILELRQQLDDFRQRFYAQFKRPDHEAPFEKQLRPGASKLRRKQYSKLDNFIQVIIRERMKNSADNMEE